MLTLTFLLAGLALGAVAAKLRFLQNLPDDGPPFEFQPEPDGYIPFEPSLEELYSDGAGDA